MLDRLTAEDDANPKPARAHRILPRTSACAARLRNATARHRGPGRNRPWQSNCHSGAICFGSASSTLSNSSATHLSQKDKSHVCGKSGPDGFRPNLLLGCIADLPEALCCQAAWPSEPPNLRANCARIHSLRKPIITSPLKCISWVPDSALKATAADC